MCTLEVLQPPPPVGYVTVCEQRGELVAIPELQDKVPLQDGVPNEITVSVRTLRSRLTKDCARSAFLEHNDTFKKILLHAWYEHGITGVLREISADHTTVSWWMSKTASKLLTTVNWINSIHHAVFPHNIMSKEDLIAEYSPNMNWHGAIVRCFSWHPHVSKFAIGLSDDTVHTYYTGKPDNLPILKHKRQKQIADLAWKPHSGSVLALACESCILIWQVDPTSLATSNVQVLDSVKHSPITSLAWDPNGQLLVSACPQQTAIMIWEVSTERSVSLRRVEGHGVSIVRWSPQGNRLFCAASNAMFRVWETQTWNCEVWKNLHSRCQSGCWSPDGSILLFCTAEEPIIYSLLFATDDKCALIGGSKSATASADLSAVDVETEDGPVRVGGRIQQLAWDPSGERLAVLFKDNCVRYIAVFQTKLKPTFEIIPCGYIQGSTDDIPSLINFLPGFENGALLSVVWSSGKISHIPMYYLSRQIVEEKGIPTQHTPLITQHKCYSTNT